jgi:protein-L-isoaspartate(D-aspartate) O-methyltransferase
MVELQLKARGIRHPNVLDAFSTVRRHVFVPEELRHRSYDDSPLPIGYNQTISQPYIVGFMIEKLLPYKTMRVLEIGTGSGYQTAILSLLFKEVYSMEIIPALASRTLEILREENCQNIKIKTGDGYLGWRKFAPYDRIIVSCAASGIPSALSNQLADNGKMIIPIGNGYQQKLMIVEKQNGEIHLSESLPVIFVPMVHRT